MNITKLIATLAFALGAWLSVGAAQADVVINVGGTNYDFSTITGIYTDNQAVLQSQPWFGSSATAMTFASALGNSLGSPNGGLGPFFVWTGDVNAAFHFDGNTHSQGVGSVSQLDTFAVVSPSAPEIDGSLAPKVGFLLGCLFLMFGRKQQNTEPMMTA